VLSEPSRSEAEKTRKETGSRACPSTVAISPEGDVVGPYSRADADAAGRTASAGQARPAGFLALLAEPDLLEEGDEVNVLSGKRVESSGGEQRQTEGAEQAAEPASLCEIVSSGD
jgi:hypothetical protein